MPKRLLSELNEEWLEWARPPRRSAGTIKTYSKTHRYFLAFCGDMYVHNVTSVHVNKYIAYRATQVEPISIVPELSALRSLFELAYDRQYIRHGAPNPLARQEIRVPRSREHQKIVVEDFPALLDAAPSPRDRILLALLLYLALRISEATYLKWEKVDLRSKSILVWKEKLQVEEDMLIVKELDRELRRWATYVTEHVGPPKPGWYVACAKVRPVPHPDPTKPVKDDRLQPNRRMGHGERIVQKAMQAIGYSIRDGNGKSLREGGHTLRRSSARAFYNRMVDTAGYDGAARATQMLLGHASFSMTEKYLGISLDKKRLNDFLLRGDGSMFPISDENVSELDKKRAEHEARAREE